jgi:hypothetical protein
MRTLEIQNEAIPILKSSLSFEKKLLEYNYKKFSRQLKSFEKKFDMTTNQFIKAFNDGSLGDDENWFDWLFASKSQSHIKNKLDIINTIEV